MGYYVDGCTVRLTCPSWLSVCSARAASRIVTSPERGQRGTLNSRLRAFSASGSLFWYRDTSCGDKVSCSTADLVYIRGGESASVQRNGVREGGHNRANVARSLKLRYEY